jgi:hypothetical protein
VEPLRCLKSPPVDTVFWICEALEVSAANVVKRVNAARKRKAGPRRLCRIAVPGLAKVLGHDAIRHDARHGDLHLSEEDNFPSKMLASQLAESAPVFIDF